MESQETKVSIHFLSNFDEMCFFFFWSFQHINGATRMILEQAGVVESAKKESTKHTNPKKGKK
jgi:hypothetical protein